MDLAIDFVDTDQQLPKQVSVVIVGGGIVGVCTALSLAQKKIPVLLCEKGEIALEQSGRNWGWVRMMGRDPAELPLGMASVRLWREMNSLVAADTGFREAGIIYVSDTEEDVRKHEKWLVHASEFEIESRLLRSDQIAEFLPGVARRFAGALYTPGDARAEPQKAVPAMANAARRLGATIVTRCAVRGIEMKAGRVCGVVTERGSVACDTVVLAGGAWSRLFCGNMGLDFPQLKVLGSVLRTAPMDGPPELTTGGSNFAFRKRLDGGYTIAHRGAAIADIVPDSFRLLSDFLPSLIKTRHELRLRLGHRFVDEARLARRWALDATSPFEQIRTLDPEPASGTLEEVKENLIQAFPAFAGMQVKATWGGLFDVTPDAVPVVSEVDTLPGFFIASGLSGHGFGLGPGVGRLAADLVAGHEPIVDPAPFRLQRLARLHRSASRAAARLSVSHAGSPP